MTVEPFTIRIPDAVLEDLGERLRRTRFTSASSPVAWRGGVDPDELSALVGWWADGFDWRAREQALNAFDHGIAHVRGTRLHFVRIGVGPAAGRLPLVLAHGWPSSFVEMLPLVASLAERAAAEGLGLDLIIPSMPGFVFSDLPDGPLTRESMADLLHGLLVDELGFDRYAVFGGDIGGTVAAWMAAKYPEHVVGLYMIHPPFPAELGRLSEAESAFIAEEEKFDVTDGGYSAIMITRPDTVAAALIDSPSGLLAWIIDKYRDWSDCGGDLASRFDRDTLLSIATLYWATSSIGTSFRQYFDYEANAPRPLITVPSGFTVSHEAPIRDMPRSIAERSCSDIRVWIVADRGGHFMPHEEPDMLADDLIAFFGSLS